MSESDSASISDRIGFRSKPFRPKKSQIELGSGEQVVVLVHGFGLNSKNWIPFVLPHLKGSRFVALDLPGHGGRYDDVPSGPGGYLEQFAAAIHQCIDQSIATLEVPKVALVGYSIGAFACLEYLRTFGSSRISKYLHIDHTPFPGEGWEGSMDQGLLRCFDEFLALEQKYLHPLDQFPHFDQTPRELVKAYYGILERLTDVSVHPVVLRSIDKFLKSLPWLGEASKQAVAWPWAVKVIKGYHSDQYDFRSDLKNMDVRTWIMGASKNRLFPLSAMEFMAREIPRSQLHVLPGGHEMQFGSPLKFHRIFSEFLSLEAQ